eukprot:2413179-Amphidinium_carterae.2
MDHAAWLLYKAVSCFPLAPREFVRVTNEPTRALALQSECVHYQCLGVDCHGCEFDMCDQLPEGPWTGVVLYPRDSESRVMPSTGVLPVEVCQDALTALNKAQPFWWRCSRSGAILHVHGPQGEAPCQTLPLTLETPPYRS